MIYAHSLALFKLNHAMFRIHNRSCSMFYFSVVVNMRNDDNDDTTTCTTTL